MRVLVTGADGNLSRYLIPSLKKCASCEIVGVTRTNFSRELVSDFKPSIVINTVNAYGTRSNTNYDIYYSNLFFGIKLLKFLEATKRNVNFINCGTALPKDYNVYSMSKHQFVEFACDFSPNNLKFINLRMQSFFGQNLSENLISYVIKNCKENSDVLLSTGWQKREFVYIDDLINAILAVVLHCDVLKHNTTVDIGAENEISVRRLTQLIKDIIGSESRLQFGKVVDNPLTVQRSNLKTLKGLGWTQKYSIKNGLQKTIGRC